MLRTRLSQIGLRPVDVIGDGNCFFRSVSHQLYGTEARHSQIRAHAIQHLIMHPEHFIESNTEQSWLHYLQSMYREGTWADHMIIQALANCQNLAIHITETALNFSESTIVHPVCSSLNTRHINVGHLDEMHYVFLQSL